MVQLQLVQPWIRPEFRFRRRWYVTKGGCRIGMYSFIQYDHHSRSAIRRSYPSILGINLKSCWWKPGPWQFTSRRICSSCPTLVPASLRLSIEQENDHRCHLFLALQCLKNLRHSKKCLHYVLSWRLAVSFYTRDICRMDGIKQCRCKQEKEFFYQRNYMVGFKMNSRSPSPITFKTQDDVNHILYFKIIQVPSWNCKI